MPEDQDHHRRMRDAAMRRFVEREALEIESEPATVTLLEREPRVLGAILQLLSDYVAKAPAAASPARAWAFDDTLQKIAKVASETRAEAAEASAVLLDAFLAEHDKRADSESDE